MKKYFFTLSILLFVWIAAIAQQEKIDYETITKIKDEGFNHSQVMDNLFNLTDVCGPRLSGSTNLKNAQAWAKKQLEAWGMSNVAIEPWGGFGRGWEIQKCYVAMTAPYYQALIAVPKAWTPGTNGLISGQAVLVRITTEQDFDKYKGALKGKIVVLAGNTEVKLGMKPDARRYTEDDLKNTWLDKMLDEDTTSRPQAEMNRPQSEIIKARNTARQFRQKLSAFLSDEGAAMILSTTRPAGMGTLFTSNGASFATDAKPVLPELEMGSEHIGRIVRLLEANKTVELEVEIKTKYLDQDTTQYNVVAEIPGTDKNLKSELVMIGAHLDSWHAGTGATDNGAGSTVMLEVMRILKTIDIHPRRTIRIALWSAEEQGLYGSKNYVKNHFGDPETMELRPDHARLSAYYNLDNGGGKIRGIYLQGNDALRPLFEAWFEPFHDLGATTVTTRSTGSTDHIAFDQLGLPGFQFIQDPMDYGTRTHHTNMDTYDRVQKNDMMQASVIIASIVYHTAMRDGKLTRKPLPKAKPKAAENATK